MPFKQFDRNALILRPIAERENLVNLSDLIYPCSAREPFENPNIPVIAAEISETSKRKSTVLFSCGAHVIKSGLGPIIVDLIERKIITHLALNGAGAIHDFELALIGGTSERVADYIRKGQFGLWKETGLINEAVSDGAEKGLGFGETVGLMIEEENFPNKNISVLAAGIRAGIPVTVHVGIGQDIIHEHPNFDPCSTGIATYRDFLIFTQSIMNLENGLFLNAGSAVMGPEVYLKALSMARNLAAQTCETISHFTTAVFDIQKLGDDYSSEADKSDPKYYFRPFKTILVRTVSDGGKSFYVCGEHKNTIPKLYDEIISRIK